MSWSAIPDGERAAFVLAVATEALKLRKEVADTAANENGPLQAQRLAAIRRKAISRAGVACDLLVIKKKLGK